MDWTTKKVDKYVIVNKKLGGGAYGIVYRGYVFKHQEQSIAVKTIPIKTLSDRPRMLEFIKREIEILQQIEAINVVKLIDVARTSNYIYLFLEYCNDGDLAQYMSKKKENRLSELESVIFLKHIVQAFKVLYSAKIIHRDIKPENILLHNGIAKISDFGFARVIETGMNDPSFFSRLGSPLYMAPQVLSGDPFSAKCDIWSIGIMLYQMLYGKPPWDGQNSVKLLENIQNQPLKFPSKPVRSQKVKDLVSRLLKYEEKDRSSWEEIFNNPVISIDEQAIRDQMRSILNETDTLARSVSLNQLYIDQNLVVGYLELNPSEKKQVIADDQFSNNNESNQTEEQDNIQILASYNEEKKMRNSILKYFYYFLFERNIGFFFNFVVQKVIKLQTFGDIHLQQDNYFRLIYVIAKNQMNHLVKLHSQLRKQQDNTENEFQSHFVQSKEYEKVFSVLENDLKQTQVFFDEIAKRTQLVLSKDAENEDNKYFFQFYNNNFTLNEEFQKYYNALITNNISHFKTTQMTGKDVLLCLFYFNICLNPYNQFDNVLFDFSQFYEDIENLSQIEILEKLK